MPQANTSREFDEISFTLTSGSGNNGEQPHTAVILASGTYTEGKNAGQAVALNCTWYNIPMDK